MVSPEQVVSELTPEQAREFLKFASFSSHFWTIPTKSRGFQPFKLNAAQRIVDADFERQMDERGFVRQNDLKCRQVGATTYWTRRALHYVMLRKGTTALTIAHEKSIPQEWLEKCRYTRDETPDILRPAIRKTQGSQLAFANGSRYYIGSAQGGFPGMGDTVHFLHKSERGRWDKPPISVDPISVLAPLKPVLPTGEDRIGTVDINESTGVMVGDNWHQTWMAGKEKDSEFHNIFLPWFLVETYRRDDMAGDVLSLSSYEHELVHIAKQHDIDLDHAQIAWRRQELASEPWFGKVEIFSAEYPATEEEAFMSPGLSVYTGEEVRLARQTQREPIWRGNITRMGAPSIWEATPNASGEMFVWRWPDERYHYVLGADCQWGKKKDADWDVLYVECLETGELCAKVKGHYPLNIWAHKIAAVGFKYNTCPVAPERNGQESLAAESVMPVLLGNVEDWRYPNIWIRTDDVKLRGHKPEDYGWWTDTHSKGQAIAFSESQTLSHDFDWCDSGAVDQMGTIIRREDNTIGSPEGLNDDDWMARIITGYVAHKQRARTSLYVEPTATVYRFRTLDERIGEIVAINDEGEDG